MLRGAYENQRVQVRQELRLGQERAKEDARRAKEKVEERIEEERIEGDTAMAPYQTQERERSASIPLATSPVR